MEIAPEPCWQDLLKRLRSLTGTALFIGRSDSGKSTLIRYLLNELAKGGRPVALVDADVGQTFLGLPGAVSRRTFTSPPGPGGFSRQELSFLGSVTPIPIISLLAAETARMVLQSRREAPLTLVDTTGLVDGPLGRALKLAKIRAVAPELVAAVTAGAELDAVLTDMPDTDSLRIAPSAQVRRRTPEERVRNRHARLAAHLEGGREILLPTRRITFLHRGVPVHPSFAPPERGTVIGLNHEAVTRALGVVTEADPDSLTVFTPLSKVRGIDRVVLGDFSYHPHAAGATHHGDDASVPPPVGFFPGGKPREVT